MKQHLLVIFTRTPLHVGSGGSVGAIDQPVQRERHTRHPIIPGTSIKGVLRATYSLHENTTDDDVNSVFGEPDKAGDLAFGEARPIAFPVRSAKGSFAFITCPLALNRFARDSGKEVKIPTEIADQSCFASSGVTLDGAPKRVVLEEYAFESNGEFPESALQLIKSAIDDPVWTEAPKRLVLLSDGDFSHFVANACEISHHNKIDPESGTVASGALFNLESVPSETLFYASVTHINRHPDSLDRLRQLLAERPLLQFGGNSTTGRGFCSVAIA
ncbi:type III-B CRISPR module RAMP protein Cmr4 [soil metagenome]